MLTVDDVNNVFSKSRIPPPKEIIMPMNTKVVVGGDGPYSNRYVLGLHKTGEDRIFLPDTSPQRTMLHEATHNIGVVGETPTRIIAAISNARVNYGIIPKLFKRKVKYHADMVPPDEVPLYMKHYGLEGSGNGIRIMRLRLEE